MENFYESCIFLNEGFFNNFDKNEAIRLIDKQMKDEKILNMIVSLHSKKDYKYKMAHRNQYVEHSMIIELTKFNKNAASQGKNIRISTLFDGGACFIIYHEDKKIKKNRISS